MAAYFDTHCHFDFPQFDSDRNDFWVKAQKQGVKKLVIPGVSHDSWPTAKKLADTLSGVYFSVGLHPWWISDAGEDHRQEEHSQEEHRQAFTKSRELDASIAEKYLSDSRCVAVGECGLHKDSGFDFPQQLIVLDQHLDLAVSAKKPLILHCYKAHNELIRALKKHSPPAGGVIHAFSGSYELAMSYYEMGFKLGIGGLVTYPRAQKTRLTVTQLPLEAIVLETDAPDSPPLGWQGKRNHPGNVALIAAEVAKLRDGSVAKVAEATFENAQNLFNLVK